MKKLTIETKTLTDVIINTPCYRISTDVYINRYYYFTDKFCLEVSDSFAHKTTYNDFSEISIANYYLKSKEISKAEFEQFYNKTINHLNSLL